MSEYAEGFLTGLLVTVMVTLLVFNPWKKR
jgi:hypothetical protein